MPFELTIPTPEDVKRARTGLGLSQAQAAGVLGSKTKFAYKTWSSYEAPTDHPRHRAMPLAIWELFLLKTSQHPLLVVSRRQTYV